jgi:hypothetical protein
VNGIVVGGLPSYDRLERVINEELKRGLRERLETP